MRGVHHFQHGGPPGRHHHHHHRHGPGRWGGGPGYGRRRRRPRGDVRAALLVLLAEEPRNGYALMQEIERRSEGMWRPSPGSVYPSLAHLEDEGLVRAEGEESGSGRRFVLTDAGRAHVEEHREQLGEPWAQPSDEELDGRMALQRLVGQLAVAAEQVAMAGDDGHVEQARKVVDDARRALYRILAD